MNLLCHHVLHTSRAHMLGRHPLLRVMIRVKVFFVTSSSTQKLYESPYSYSYSKSFKTLFLCPQCFLKKIKWALSVSYLNMGTKPPESTYRTSSLHATFPNRACMPSGSSTCTPSKVWIGCDSFVIAIHWWVDSDGCCLIPEMKWFRLM